MPRTVVRRKTRGAVPRRIIRKANRKRKATGLEKAVHSMLKAEKIPFSAERTIGSCHADIAIEPRTLIELNGCYWHGHTCQKKLSKMQLGALSKDARRYAFFQKLGFDVHVIWECEVEKDSAGVQEKLAKIYRSANDAKGSQAKN